MRVKGSGPPTEQGNAQRVCPSERQTAGTVILAYQAECRRFHRVASHSTSPVHSMSYENTAAAREDAAGVRGAPGRRFRHMVSTPVVEASYAMSGSVTEYITEKGAVVISALGSGRAPPIRGTVGQCLSRSALQLEARERAVLRKRSLALHVIADRIEHGEPSAEKK